ncbi:MAG: hypothetical protein ACE5GK_06015 [Nitrospiria bacterium]
MGHEIKEKPKGLLSRLLPSLVLFGLFAALSGAALTFLLPTQVLKPESIIAMSMVQKAYQEMIDRATAPFPGDSTAYVEREACWTRGKRVCIYGWYAEWHGDVYLMSYTLANESDENNGTLRGWWWEVDVAQERVRPIWLDDTLRHRYNLQRADAIQNASGPEVKPPPFPTAPPLLKRQ